MHLEFPVSLDIGTRDSLLPIETKEKFETKFFNNNLDSLSYQISIENFQNSNLCDYKF